MTYRGKKESGRQALFLWTGRGTGKQYCKKSRHDQRKEQQSIGYMVSGKDWVTTVTSLQSVDARHDRRQDIAHI